MGQRLNLFGNTPAFVETVSLDGQQYRLRFVWIERMAGWYMGLHDLADAVMVAPVRLSPGYSPLLGLRPDGGPSGYFLVTGPNEYTMEQLGTDLLVEYKSLEEIQAQAPAEDEETALRILFT